MAQLQRIAIAPSQLSHPHLSLTSDQQHYLSRVLRLQVGDRFIAIDASGQWWLSELGADLARARVLEAIAVQSELPVEVILLVAMPKGNGMDEVVRQVTELGVRQIVPVISDRTLLNPSPQKLDRWRRIAQEAAEQSERQRVPEILAPMPFKQAIEQWNSGTSHCYLCEARGNYPHLLLLLQKIVNLPNQSMVIATGPEGGWTDGELEGAIAVGYQPVSLGRRILRSVTAPLMALSLISSVFESM